jgi:hypothetical protein
MAADFVEFVNTPTRGTNSTHQFLYVRVVLLKIHSSISSILNNDMMQEGNSPTQTQYKTSPVNRHHNKIYLTKTHHHIQESSHQNSSS